MKRLTGVCLLLVLAAVPFLTACGGGGSDNENASAAQVPAEYSGKTNPHEGDAQAIQAGQAIYQSNCATCHGDGGKGDGAAGQALNPQPKDLTVRTDEQTDGYFYWRIAEGGAMPPYNSAMPAWKAVMSEDQIWQVVSYIRSVQK